MAIIDKAMYEYLKKWSDRCEEVRPKNQYLLYVNSHNRELTNATIRKLMFELNKEDPHGELYSAFYTAKNFYRNMRNYYSNIGELYLNEPKEDDSLIDIVDDYPPTCGWIMLIVEDIEALSENERKMKEMMETIFKFAVNRPSIILIGNGDYKEVFSGCEYALSWISDGLAAKEEDDELMIGIYDQEISPIEEMVTYESGEKQRDELVFYWNLLYAQLEKGYFDYNGFKVLFKESLEYIIPRVTKEQVYRKDLLLIENIGALGSKNPKDVDGCTPWEYDSAKEYSDGLHAEIVNKYDSSDNFSEGTIGIGVMIEEKTEDYGNIHIGGSFCTTVKISVENVCDKIDRLSDAIYECTYKGNSAHGWRFLCDKQNEDDSGEESSEQMDNVKNSMAALMDSIKKAADETINRDPGRKVRRYKDNPDEDNSCTSKEEIQ